jgi:hypothetical protein
MFAGRKLVIATKHKKEKAIAPFLEQELGVKCTVPSELDTDFFGTFTGEIERKSDPLSTARQKCELAMAQSACDLAVASEGSFGAHPTIFFAHADDELLVFIDKKNNLEIVAKELSLETNFAGGAVENSEELLEFAKKAGFPSHALILRPSKENHQAIFKGITNQKDLLDNFEKLESKYRQVYVETDMRALYNPMRMAVIEKASQKLVQKIKSVCSECRTPGFGIVEVKKGLRCSLCGYPTNSTLSYLYICQVCEFTKEQLYPHGKIKENPTYCDLCNP